MKKGTEILYYVLIGSFVIGMVIFFFPKTSSYYGEAFDISQRECSCFGFERKSIVIGGAHNTCYGVVYSCQYHKMMEIDGVAKRVDIEKIKKD